MPISITNEEGSIILNKPVIGKIVSEVVKNYGEKVYIHNYKNKAVSFATKMFADEMNNMEITKGKNGLDVKIYIVIKFGTSISRTVNSLIHDINEEILRITGIETNSISIVVTGVVSKNIAKRKIEIRG